MPAGKGRPVRGGNTSSDFVRKLYRMLEEPEYTDIVRWGRNGDSFVVLEGENFSTRVLPKHFKHGNFASFVRQLNKYDFHKVRRPDDASQGYGPSAWEFKHPDFRIDAKDNLDVIRRKAPSSKKGQQKGQRQQTTAPDGGGDGGGCASDKLRIKSLTDDLSKLQSLVEELAQTNQELMSEVVSLQKTTGVQCQVHYELLHYLENSSGRAAQAAVSPQVGTVRAQANDLPSSLRRARELLDTVGSPPATADGSKERPHPMYPSPADSSTSEATFVAPDTSSGIAVMDGAVTMSRMGAYPASQAPGIEAFDSDHLSNMSYPVARDGNLDGMMATGVRHSTRVTVSLENTDEWGLRKPHVFLVEDDAICAKIGMKFLKSLGCTVVLATDGFEAVKLFDGKPVPHFDLIFMDIIMPRLDGVAASARIREWLPHAAIIAMTSNVRQEEVETYFQYGMTDVLAKPFMRGGMQRMLRRHVSHLLAEPTAPQSAADDGSWASPGPVASHPGAMASHSPADSPLVLAGSGAFSSAGELVLPGGQPGGYHGYMGQGIGGERPEKRRRESGPTGMMR